jgi:hypothetical protein
MRDSVDKAVRILNGKTLLRVLFDIFRINKTKMALIWLQSTL